MVGLVQILIPLLFQKVVLPICEESQKTLMAFYWTFSHSQNNWNFELVTLPLLTQTTARYSLQLQIQ